MVGIHLITNLVNGKKYIGQSIHCNSRYTQHKSSAKTGSKQLLHRAIRKYGEENFSFDIIELCTKEQLNDLETLYIELANSIVPNGYNICHTGNGSIESRLISKEHRQKLSLKTKEMWADPVKRKILMDKRKITNASGSPTTLKRIATNKVNWENNPDRVKRESEKMKLRMSNPEFRARAEEGLKNVGKK